MRLGLKALNGNLYKGEGGGALFSFVGCKLSALAMRGGGLVSIGRCF